MKRVTRAQATHPTDEHGISSSTRKRYEKNKVSKRDVTISTSRQNTHQTCSVGRPNPKGGLGNGKSMPFRLGT